MSRQAFITGSRRYGTPTEDSDVDLVLECDDDTMLTLLTHFAKDQETRARTANYDEGSMSIRVGKLNLICCVKKEAYDAFSLGTGDLCEHAALNGPVTREEAVRVFRAYREEFGLTKTEEA